MRSRFICDQIWEYTFYDSNDICVADFNEIMTISLPSSDYLLDLFYIGLGSFIGVSLRISLSYEPNDFNVGNGDDFTPFIRLFYTQPSLLPNMVGCFIVALLVFNQARITSFNPPLFKLLSTGMCSCLTTYSSWINDAFGDILNKKWYYHLVMAALEFCIIWSIFSLGFLTATVIQSTFCRPHKSQNQELQSSNGTNDNKLQTSQEPQPNQANATGDTSNYEAVESNEIEISTTPDSPEVFSITNKTEEETANNNTYKNIGIYILFNTIFAVLWIIVLVDAGNPFFEKDRARDWLRSLAFAPFGAWLRWELSKSKMLIDMSQNGIFSIFCGAKKSTSVFPTFIGNQLSVFLIVLLTALIPKNAWSNSFKTGNFYLNACSWIIYFN